MYCSFTLSCPSFGSDMCSKRIYNTTNTLYHSQFRLLYTDYVVDIYFKEKSTNNSFYNSLSLSVLFLFIFSKKRQLIVFYAMKIICVLAYLNRVISSCCAILGVDSSTTYSTYVLLYSLHVLKHEKG